MLTDTKIAAFKPPASGQEEHSDHKVTGLRLRVGTGGKKTWILRRRVGAKVINKKLGGYPSMGLAAARIAADNVIAALERDGSTEALDRTFGTVAQYWIDKVAKPNNGSWRDQQRRLEMHVLPAWNDRKIAQIKRADVRDLLDGLEGVVLPNRVLTIIKTIFRFALSRDWLDASPVEGIAKPKSETDRDRVLDMGEVKSILDAAKLIGFPFGHFIQMLALTAQRRSEVANMRWSEIDMEAATWTQGAAGNKSARAHMVPLSAPAVAILKALPRLGDAVFSLDGEQRVLGYAKGKTQLDQFIAAKGGTMAPWRLHDLRRSAATHMVRLGVNETTVGRVLNHAPQGVTAKVYALHSYAPEKRHALDAWAAEIGRAMGDNTADNVIALR